MSHPTSPRTGEMGHPAATKIISLGQPTPPRFSAPLAKHESGAPDLSSLPDFARIDSHPDAIEPCGMPCLFCQESDGLTTEHVFPAVLGGKLVVPNCTCQKCATTTSQFEDAFARKAQPSRQTFEIPNRYGTVPNVPVTIRIKGVEGVEELHGLRKPTGELIFQPKVIELPSEDGKKVTRGIFVDNAVGAEKFVTRRRARGETISNDGEQVLPKDVIVQAVSTQSLEFAFMEEARRTAAKCALVALAYQYGIDYARLAQFDNLRNAVMRQPKELLVNIFANPDFKDACLRSPRHHSVIAHLSGGRRKAWAAVTLFGGLSYIIELSGDFNECQSRSFTLFYDTEMQRTFNPILLYDEHELIGRVLSESTVFNDQNAVDEQWFSVVQGYCRSKGYEIERISSSEGKS